MDDFINSDYSAHLGWIVVVFMCVACPILAAHGAVSWFRKTGNAKHNAAAQFAFFGFLALYFLRTTFR